MTGLEKSLKFFRKKPYLLRMGANKVAKQCKVLPQEIIEARKIIQQEAKINRKVNILIFDIETSPLKAYVWSRWRQNIYLDQTIAEWFMICWSAKWLGSQEVMSDVLTPEEIKKEDDSRIVTSLWTIMDRADIIIAHNGKRFDVPKMNSRFILTGLPPTSPYQQIDTKEIAAKQFGFSSNKLDALAGYFGVVHKDDTDFQLWVDCLEGNEEALSYMETYNIKDVKILEQVYLKLRPWIKNHPNLGLYLEESKEVCPVCGSGKLIPDGTFYYTSAGKYEVMRCTSCGATSRLRQTVFPKSKKKNLTASI